MPAAASSPGSLQRSRSDVDVNAAASATARTRMPAVPSTVPSSASPFSSASALPPGSYASLGETAAHVAVILLHTLLLLLAANWTSSSTYSNVFNLKARPRAQADLCKNHRAHFIKTKNKKDGSKVHTTKTKITVCSKKITICCLVLMKPKQIL